MTSSQRTPRLRGTLSTIGRIVRSARVGLLLVTYFTAMVSAQATTALADQPLFTNTAVPGNLALALSVEWPTVSRAAHPNNTYSSNNTYLGYFDPGKCYRYVRVTTETATDVSRFDPVGMAAGRKCAATGTNGDWSGNFLNWATMIAIDPFRWALTGGLRKVDTPTTTVLERARHSGQGSLFPNRSLGNATTISEATPLTWAGLQLRVNGAGTRLIFANTTALLGAAPSHYEQSNSDALVTYYVEVRVKVCDPSLGVSGLESNCRQYGSNYKPEGLIQQYSDRMRYSAFGYLNDSSMTRDGGVLRARQKYVGPQSTVPGSSPITNPLAEWSAVTGVFYENPNPADAFAFGTAVPNSGVINYLNKFGQLTNNTHKNFDPVSEMYYAVTRYFRRLSNVPEWVSGNGANAATLARWADAFPVITDWEAEDPVQYSCQRNFALGIGDIYTHRDKNLPGSGTGGVDEPGKPAAVANDTAVNSVTETTKAFALQGLSTPNSNNYSGRNNSAGMVGLAYYANTRDIRPDLPGKQTMQTYWVDVLEAPFVNNNQFLLAAKYGGFKLPDNFDPINHSAAFPDAWWHTTGDLLPGNVKRPDNYFTAGEPDQMVDGLTRAFASIAAALRAYTTSFSTALPQVSVAGNASFAAQFDSENWTGEVAASELSFDAITGAPSQTPRWSFASKLATQLAGTGWNINRRVISRNSDTGQGVPFRAASLATTQMGTLDSTYRTGDDSGAFLDYLRGDRQHEQASTTTGSFKAYRTRAGLLADVVNSKARPVGPPSLPLSNSSNPGYGTFKSSYASRPTIVYLGSNGGMLHAINGALTGTNAGKEMFAYVPSALFSGPTGAPATNGLVALGNPTFAHHYYVNATPGVFDIDFGRVTGGSGTADWRTVLISGLGKGGKSYFALDVTDPAGMITGANIAAQEANAAGKVLWEFSHADLGYTYGEPVVVKSKRHGGKWVVMLPSGYNNGSGQGFIFVLNPATGALIEKIRVDTGTASGNGLAHLNAYVLDRTDGVADAIYAGDVGGYVWRAELNTVLTSVGGDYVDTSGYKAVAIATLTNAANQPQPVTTRPLIEVDPRTGRRFVLVGTGMMLDNTHIGSTVQQSFYAIVDGRNTRYSSASDLPSGISFPIGRGDLADNTNLLDNVAYNTTTQIGWYIEMGTGSGSLGWRVISDPSSAFGIVVFASTLPSGDACNPTGSSRIYAVNMGTGMSVLTSGADYVNYNTSLTGVVTDLRFFTVNGVPRLIAGSDSGELQAPPGTFGSAGTIRRLNWRELPVAN